MNINRMAQKGGEFIKNLVFDCDGVLTDGKYYYSKDGKQFVTFHANDSVAVRLAKEDGMRVIMISSGSYQDINKKRAEDVGFEHFYTPFGNKANMLASLVNLNETAYIGDCLDDIPIFEVVKMAFAPASALPIVQDKVDYVLSRKSGEGCLLEAFLKVRELDEKARELQKHSRG